MDSCVGKVVFCSISRKERILYSYNGGDSSVDSLARLCLSRAPPPFHRHYFHTAAGRTFAFLCQGDLTYFLIITTTTTTDADAAANSSSSSKPRILNLLHQIHHGFGSGRDEMVATVKRLIESAEESMSRLDHQNQNTPSPTTTTKAPLLPDRRGVVVEEVSLEVEEADPVELQQLQKKRLATGMWRRHAKIVVVADVAVCGVLFGVWMAVCRGFRCVS